MSAEELYRIGRERWPGFGLDQQTFCRLFEPHAGPGERHAEDLYLAFACAIGDEQAVAELERSHMPAAIAAVRRMRGSEASAEEIAQRIRAHILVAAGDAPPRIATYAGTGSLRRWLTAVAVRAYLNSLRAKKREVLIGDANLMDAIGANVDSPELALLRESYREEFRAGFSEALDRLEPKQKTLLRLRFVDGLTVADLARLNNVHRATLHRWLADALEEIAGAMETILCGRLSVSPDELASIRRLVRSQLEVSLERLLED